MARRDRLFFSVALFLYALIAVPIGIRRGTDFAIHVPLAQAWLAGTPLYHPNPGVGIWWPPFAIVVVAPFAALAGLSSLAWAKGAWALASIACLGWALVGLSKDGWRILLVALLAVLVPLHRNFEDLNLNAFLLALWVAAVRDLESEHETRASIWLGMAAALKIFPGLLLAYFVLRRRWRALAAGVATAVVLTVLPLWRYGLAAPAGILHTWLTNGAEFGAAMRGSNQSLAALATRLHLPLAGLMVLDLGCVALALTAMRRSRAAHPPFVDLGILALIAVLMSPIAWVHYFLFGLPAWMIALQLSRGQRGPWSRGPLVLAGIGTSGLLTVWSLSLRDTVFALSLYTWGALVLLGFLAFVRTPPASHAVTPRPV